MNDDDIRFGCHFSPICNILVLAGAGDLVQSPADLRAFEATLSKQTTADWRLIFYGRAGHAFTQPDSGINKYNKEADRRSWQAMQDFFKEVWYAPNSPQAN